VKVKPGLGGLYAIQPGNELGLCSSTRGPHRALTAAVVHQLFT